MAMIVFLLAIVGVNVAVSFVFAMFIRSKPLLMVGSVVVTEMLLAIYGLNQFLSTKSSNHPEDILLATNLSLMISLPVVILASTGFVLVWGRYASKRLP